MGSSSGAANSPYSCVCHHLRGGGASVIAAGDKQIAHQRGGAIPEEGVCQQQRFGVRNADDSGRAQAHFYQPLFGAPTHDLHILRAHCYNEELQLVYVIAERAQRCRN